MTDSTDTGGKSHKRRPTVSRRPTRGKVVEEEETENKEEVKVAKEEAVEGPPPQLVVKTG